MWGGPASPEAYSAPRWAGLAICALMLLIVPKGDISGHAPGVDHEHIVLLLELPVRDSGAAEPPITVRSMWSSFRFSFSQ